MMNINRAPRWSQAKYDGLVKALLGVRHDYKTQWQPDDQDIDDLLCQGFETFLSTITSAWANAQPPVDTSHKDEAQTTSVPSMASGGDPSLPSPEPVGLGTRVPSPSQTYPSSLVCRTRQASDSTTDRDCSSPVVTLPPHLPSTPEPEDASSRTLSMRKKPLVSVGANGNLEPYTTEGARSLGTVARQALAISRTSPQPSSSDSEQCTTLAPSTPPPPHKQIAESVEDVTHVEAQEQWVSTRRGAESSFSSKAPTPIAAPEEPSLEREPCGSSVSSLQFEDDPQSPEISQDVGMNDEAVPYAADLDVGASEPPPTLEEDHQQGISTAEEASSQATTPMDTDRETAMTTSPYSDSSPFALSMKRQPAPVDKNGPATSPSSSACAAKTRRRPYSSVERDEPAPGLRTPPPTIKGPQYCETDVPADDLLRSCPVPVRKDSDLSNKTVLVLRKSVRLALRDHPTELQEFLKFEERPDWKSFAFLVLFWGTDKDKSLDCLYQMVNKTEKTSSERVLNSSRPVWSRVIKLYNTLNSQISLGWISVYYVAIVASRGAPKYPENLKGKERSQLKTIKTLGQHLDIFAKAFGLGSVALLPNPHTSGDWCELELEDGFLLKDYTFSKGRLQNACIPLIEATVNALNAVRGERLRCASQKAATILTQSGNKYLPWVQRLSRSKLDGA